jgi:hypothetical protein
MAAVLLMATIASPLLAQDRADQDAINRLIDRYSELEDVRDMVAQSRLMTADRVWIAQWQGRMTNQDMNMRLQQANFDALDEFLPGIQWFTDARDRLIKFYGNGSVAVASFYWYRSFVLPADTPAEIAEAFVAFNPAVITLVLEKQGGDWKIVHTHNSELSQPPG